MKILIIGYVWPEPNSTGAGVRFSELINLFSSHDWQMHFTSPATPTEHSLQLQDMGIQSHCIEVNDDAFDAYISNLQPDIVLFDRFLMEEQFGWRVAKHCPQALRILETIDLHFLRDARQQAHKAQRKVQDVDLHNAIALREVASIYRSDLSLLISDYELELLQNHFHIHPDLLHLCPFMIQPEHIHQHSPSFEQRQHFISIGNFRHAPNWDAVLWLKQEIWSPIRQQLPHAELHIYGAYTPPKATALHQAKDGFIIQDRAKDLRQVMQQSRVCLAPLRFGAGIKTKLADAMRHGTPNVTTNMGAEGMTAGLPWSGSIADDAPSFAAAAVQLYQNQHDWQHAQQYGFDIVHQLFNPQKNGSALIKRIQHHLEHLQTYRQSNFIGSMLNHHHHRSTEFMSRWIHAKNKCNTGVNT
ncbi:MAG: glycosyltransferase [Mariprofundaceae bacterium]|nr:glycosyltransferase [Mariprofundaceae bacterium]